MIALLMSGGLSLAVALVGTRYLIEWLRKLGIGQPIREEGPEGHHTKAGTPTMGGTVIIAATVIGYLAAHAATGSSPTGSGLLVLFLMAGLGLVGFLDDFIKISRQRSLGLRSKQKLAGQALVAIIFAVLAIVTLLPGKADFLATLYSFGAMLSFTIAHFAVIWLRKRQPDVTREWKPPLNFKFRGVSVPATAVLGGIGTLLAWLVVMALNPVTLAVGTGWLVVGIAVYFLYRRHHNLPLTETVKVLLPQPLGVEELEYQSVMVVVSTEEPFSEDMIATAVKLASKRRRGILMTVLVPVPVSMSLDCEMTAKETYAQSLIERVKLIAGTRVSGRVERVRPGQEGYFIARQAKAIKAAAIVVSLRFRNGTPMYTKSLETVLRERPCRVIVVSDGPDMGTEATTITADEGTPA